MDRGRYGISEERQALGGSGAPVLRTVGQAGQLSGGSQLSVATSKAACRSHGGCTCRRWAKDRKRRKKAGVQTGVKFQTKPQIALEQMRAAKAAGVAIGMVLADAGYGNETAWREALTRWSWSIVWESNRSPRCGRPARGLWLPAKNKIGRPRTRWQRVAGATPLSVKEVAETLTEHRWRTVDWREGTNEKLSPRFAAVRVRAAHRDEEGLRAPRQKMVVDRMAGRSSRTDQVLAVDVAR